MNHLKLSLIAFLLSQCCIVHAAQQEYSREIPINRDSTQNSAIFFTPTVPENSSGGGVFNPGASSTSTSGGGATTSGTTTGGTSGGTTSTSGGSSSTTTSGVATSSSGGTSTTTGGMTTSSSSSTSTSGTTTTSGVTPVASGCPANPNFKYGKTLLFTTGPIPDGVNNDVVVSVQTDHTGGGPSLETNFYICRHQPNQLGDWLAIGNGQTAVSLGISQSAFDIFRSKYLAVDNPLIGGGLGGGHATFDMTDRTTGASCRYSTNVGPLSASRAGNKYKVASTAYNDTNTFGAALVRTYNNRPPTELYINYGVGAGNYGQVCFPKSLVSSLMPGHTVKKIMYFHLQNGQPY